MNYDSLKGLEKLFSLRPQWDFQVSPTVQMAWVKMGKFFNSASTYQFYQDR